MDPQRFAEEWAEGWNSHDLDRIMAHDAEGIVFRSRKAAALVGQGTITGKAALRDYWRQALERQPDLHFTVQDVLVGHEMLVITYLNRKSVLAAETVIFNASGKVVIAGACHRDQ